MCQYHLLTHTFCPHPTLLFARPCIRLYRQLCRINDDDCRPRYAPLSCGIPFVDDARCAPRRRNVVAAFRDPDPMGVCEWCRGGVGTRDENFNQSRGRGEEECLGRLAMAATQQQLLRQREQELELELHRERQRQRDEVRAQVQLRAQINFDQRFDQPFLCHDHYNNLNWPRSQQALDMAPRGILERGYVNEYNWDWNSYNSVGGYA